MMMITLSTIVSSFRGGAPLLWDGSHIHRLAEPDYRLANTQYIVLATLRLLA